MSRPAIKLAVPSFSLERQALARALAEAGPIRAAADAARVRVEAARGALAAAIGAVPSAERAASEARADAVNDPAASRDRLRALRQAVADAMDDVEIAREIANRSEAASTETERDVRYAMEKIEAAADAVVVMSFDAALQSAEHAGREFARLTYAAGIIAQAASPWSGARAKMTDSVAVLNPQFVFRGNMAAAEAAQNAAAAPWREARAALLTDPHAPLPEVG